MLHTNLKGINDAKTTLIATALSFVLLTPAVAQSVTATCDEASLAAAEQQVYKMQDQKAKEDAMSQIGRARMAIKDNDMASCQKYVDELNMHLKKT